jgi:ketosteroid isomerase-like protein
MSNTEIVRASFDAYVAQDRHAAERLMSEDLVFTSPLERTVQPHNERGES